MRIFLLDDEQIVRNGLRRIIENQDAMFEVVGEAQDGPEALHLLPLLEPDVCIVDICMHHMSGIEFIRRAKEIVPAARYIVLSGYAEFQYARELMEIGCKTYLTKPINHEELFLTLYKLNDEINLAKDERRQRMAMEEKLQSVQYLQREQLLRRMIVAGIREEDVPLLTECDLAWLLDSFSLAIIETSRSAWDLESVLNASADRIRESAFIVCSANELAYLAHADRDEMEQTILYYCSEILEKIREKPVCGICLHETCLQTAIDRAREAVRKGFTDREQIIHYYHPAVVLPNTDFSQYENQILSWLAAYRGDELGKCVRDMLVSVEREQLHASVCAMILRHLYFIVRVKLSEMQCDDILERIPPYGSFAKMTDGFHSLDGMSAYVLAIFDEIAKRLGLDVNADGHWIVLQAKRYIENNYMREISLGDVARHVSLNPSYLSSIFKQKTGSTYSSYLTQVRMEHAKELLLNTNMKVYDIGKRVGYPDSKYFYRIFRQHAGATPGYFRDEYRGNTPTNSGAAADKPKE